MVRAHWGETVTQITAADILPSSGEEVVERDGPCRGLHGIAQSAILK
jgi:hypothetical protein